MNRKSLLLSAAAALLVLSGLEYYLQAQPAEFPLGVGAESLSSNVELLDAGLTVRLACRTAGSGSARGPVVEMTHEPAFMRDVFRNAKASSGKIMIAG